MCESPQSLVWLTTFEIHHLKNQRFCFDSSPWCWYLSIILQGEDIGRRFNKNNLREQRLCHANAGSKKKHKMLLAAFWSIISRTWGTCPCYLLHFEAKNMYNNVHRFLAGVHWFFNGCSSFFSMNCIDKSRWFSSIVPCFFRLFLNRFPWCSSIVCMFVISHDFSQVSMLCSALFDAFHRFVAGLG